MKRLIAPLAWTLIGASLAATWFLVASGSSEIDDGRAATPSQVVEVESSVRDATASASLIVTFPSVDVPAQVAGRITSISQNVPSRLPPEGVVWGEVEGRPRILAGATNAFAFHRTLARGSRGGDVEVLQAFLADLDFYDGPLDGQFGVGVERSLTEFRESLGAQTADNELQVGDLAFADDNRHFELVDLVVGTDLSASTPIGSLRAEQPSLQLRFFPQDASLVIEGSRVEGDGFVGVVDAVAIEPLALEGGGTVRVGIVDGELNRPVAAGETLQVLVTINATPRLWLPVASIAIDATGSTYAVDPSGESIRLELGRESGGFVEVVSGAAEGAAVLLPNPDLLRDS